MAKQNYQFQGKDFRPINGACDYLNRNHGDGRFRTELRGCLLMGYNNLLIGAPVFLSIFGAIKGIEALVK